MERFLDNPALRVREWYDPTARDWLSYIARTTGTIRLIADALNFAESRVWASAVDDRGGVSPAGDPDLLDVGAYRTRA